MSRSTGLQRGLDRHVGDAFALVLALRRPTACSIADPGRIGFVQPTAIGDLIVASGLFAHVHATFPRAELHLLHGASNGAGVCAARSPGVTAALGSTHRRVRNEDIRPSRQARYAKSKPLSFV
jgi:hypothetical protein